MADSPAFDWVCQEIERETNLDRLESRGTVRIALRQSGLEAASVLPDQMRVVIERMLPEELTSRGVESAPDLCARMANRVSSVELRTDADSISESPDAVFRRLGGADS